jgi:HIRAN domain.
VSDLIPDDRNNVVSLFHDKGGSLPIPKPFERDIFLFDTYVAGTGYVEGMEDIEPHLHGNDRLDFFREPDNPHDSKAIVIRTTGGAKIGYVPRADNVIFSRLMDAGKLLFARIESKEMSGSWLKIEIRVYLHE